MIEAVLLDFYGTVVHEDDALIEAICAVISEASTTGATPRDVGRHLSQAFFAALDASHADTFESQRLLERRALALTIEHVGADCNADELGGRLYDHWQRPPLFDDARRFLDAVDLPVVVVSNIDDDDITAAINHHNLSFRDVITSEQVRAYKPRPELFRAGLAALGCDPGRVLHVGDSRRSDVLGAQRLGIPVAWVNRSGKAQGEPAPTFEVTSLDELVPVVLGSA